MNSDIALLLQTPRSLFLHALLLLYASVFLMQADVHPVALGQMQKFLVGKIARVVGS